MIKYKEFTKEFLSYTWNWLNDKEIKALTNTPDFSKESQLEWFNGLRNLDNYQIWGLVVDDVPIGACGLKNITQNDCEYWGYIGDKQYWGKGYGKNIVNRMMMEARKKGLKSIWLRVVKNNPRAIRLYEKTDFIIEKSFENELIMRKEL